jgi:large exoprotein involved in heme utilization and adhesion
LLDGGSVGTGTLSSGNSGNIRLRASQLEVSGATPAGFTSLVAASVASPSATGNGGNIRVNADRLQLIDGGQITSSSIGSGNAGNVTVVAQSSLELSGVNRYQSQNGRDGNAAVAFNSTISAASTPITPNGRTGSAGSVNIQADRVRVSDRASITVSSLGSGNAGNLNLSANTLQLFNSSLQAESNAGNQGNIRLDANTVSLFDRSRITTNAQGTATGGNINVNTRYLFAFQNSDITANSTSNFGGQVSITAEGIFGAEFRPNLTPDNDITASSGLGTGFSGTVTLQTPNIDPGQGLTQLPETVLDPNAQVASTCQAIAQNTFVVTGRGGLPATPATNSSDRPWSDLRDLSTFLPQESNAVPVAAVPQEATGWRVGQSGQLELVAIVPTLPQSLQQPTCAPSPAK